MTNEMQQKLARIRAAFIKVRDFDDWEDHAEFQEFINKAIGGVDELDRALAQLPAAEDLAASSRIKEGLRDENEELRDENARLAALVDAGAAPVGVPDGRKLVPVEPNLAMVNDKFVLAVLKWWWTRNNDAPENTLRVELENAGLVPDWFKAHWIYNQDRIPNFGVHSVDIAGLIYRAMLSAAPAATADAVAKDAGWQPIETAPKDSFSRMYRINGFAVQGFVDATGQLMIQSEISPHWRMARGKPTHWMPLPAAPDAAMQGKEQEQPASADGCGACGDACECRQGVGQLKGESPGLDEEIASVWRSAADSGIKLSITDEAHLELKPEQTAAAAPANPYTDNRLRQGWERGFAGRQPFNYPPDADYMAAYINGKLARVEHQKKQVGL